LLNVFHLYFFGKDQIYNFDYSFRFIKPVFLQAFLTSMII